MEENEKRKRKFCACVDYMQRSKFEHLLPPVDVDDCEFVPFVGLVELALLVVSSVGLKNP
jgi:hypothetical protein